MTSKLTPKQQYQAAWHAERLAQRNQDWRERNRTYASWFSPCALHSLENREWRAFETLRIHTYANSSWTREEVKTECYRFYGICGVLRLDAEVYQEA